MATFSVKDAVAANFSPDVISQLAGWDVLGQPDQWKQWDDSRLLPLLKTLPFTPTADGQVSVPDDLLASSMDKKEGSFLGFTPEMWGVGATFGGLASLGGGLSNLFSGGDFLSGLGNFGKSIAGAGGSSPLSLADASWGVNPQGDVAFDPAADFGPEYFAGNSAYTGFPMPAAIPETPAQLTEWGLKEVSPGTWAMPSIPGSASTAANWLSKIASDPATWGKVAATALGVVGSNQQAKSLQELSSKYQEYGAPSRARFEASMTPGFDPTTIPGYSGALDTASKSILAKLSASGGNPFGNPGGLIDANKQIVSGTALPAINEYQRLNANTGFGNSMNAALGLQQQEVAADGNSLNALGFGLNALTNPQPTLADLIKQTQSGFKVNDWF